ncbi:hypothetical protein TBLA_0I00700 [Henningerozyma blattae CBS 6284]|uniref:Mitochondrial inner membrane i-AAA protease supercomplex subunit MGR3 n=1 Tax=Henningerozyma blattae (strain ATCC 34711 / CBS 6284 / DSM 70876 / NBRC 10599 / NRRL Y-10934 / UCD 77-7) TaxID=1071380 RepID=I2H8M6_HENB6|nr:hypothetical protein TBLA_0I00700 [Tetrapisispora blattae CBS 6284]CCH62728.1 hypothetical protein TBLA_0I00700 [Tetrapisispora blattae CBS 6284]
MRCHIHKSSNILNVNSSHIPLSFSGTTTNFQQRRKHSLKYYFGVGALVGLCYGIWEFTNTPSSPFPTEVADKLKDALWAESEKENFNSRKALKFYINALEQCNISNMDNLSDEYTSIELKIAELYQKLGQFEEANDMYLELLARYFSALSTTDLVEEDRRGTLIRRDLRVLIKSLETNKDLSLGRRNLLAHLLLAQEEVLSKSPELKNFFEKRKQKTIDIFNGKSTKEPFEFKTYVNEENIKVNEDGYMTLNMNHNSSAWEPFKEEFFTARDLYTAYCLSAKDITAALGCKMTTVEWMVMADMPPSQILLSQANLGSLLYLQAEKFAAEADELQSKLNEATIGNDESRELAIDLRTISSNKERSLKMASQCYESVIDFAKKNKKLRFKIKEELDPSASQAIALSTYGIGVLSIQNGSFAKAENLLKEAISLANDTGFVELLSEASLELDKLTDRKAKFSNLSK